MARMIDEQYPLARWEGKAEQQEAANVELRNRRAMQPAGQLDARNATLKCRRPGIEPGLLACRSSVLPLHHGIWKILSGLSMSSQITTVVCAASSQAVHFPVGRGDLFHIAATTEKCFCCNSHLSAKHALNLLCAEVEQVLGNGPDCFGISGTCTMS